MKVNEVVVEGIWDEIKAGYQAGREDYIRRQAAKLGLTPAQAVQQAQNQPPGSNAPPAPSQYSSAASGFKPSNIRATYGAPTTPAPKPVAKPMSYGGTATASFGSTAAKPTATTPTVAPKPPAPATPTGVTTATATPAKTKPRMSVRAATGGATPPVASQAGTSTPSTPAATGTPATAPVATAVKASDIIPNLQGLSKNELNKLYVQLANLVNAPVGSTKK